MKNLFITLISALVILGCKEKEAVIVTPIEPVVTVVDSVKIQPPASTFDTANIEYLVIPRDLRIENIGLLPNFKSLKGIFFEEKIKTRINLNSNSRLETVSLEYGTTFNIDFKDNPLLKAINIRYVDIDNVDLDFSANRLLKQVDLKFLNVKTARVDLSNNPLVEKIFLDGNEFSETKPTTQLILSENNKITSFSLVGFKAVNGFKSSDLKMVESIRLSAVLNTADIVDFSTCTKLQTLEIFDLSKSPIFAESKPDPKAIMSLKRNINIDEIIIAKTAPLKIFKLQFLNLKKVDLSPYNELGGVMLFLVNNLKEIDLTSSKDLQTISSNLNSDIEKIIVNAAQRIDSTTITPQPGPIRVPEIRNLFKDEWTRLIVK